MTRRSCRLASVEYEYLITFYVQTPLNCIRLLKDLYELLDEPLFLKGVPFVLLSQIRSNET